MRFDSSLITRVQQANDITDVISEHLSLSRRGKEMVGVCPFHEDHRPSMYVNPDKQIFKCFACGAGGDVIKFVQMREGLTFYRAIERLAERAGIKIDIPKEAAGRKNPGIDPARIQKLNDWAGQHWQKNLRDEKLGAKAREYIQQRGFSPETTDNFKLGLAVDKWDDLLKAAAERKIPYDLSKAAGVIVERQQGHAYDKFRNRLMFPIVDASGRTIGFGGRTLANDPAKYMNSPATLLFDKSKCLYGLDKARHEIVSTGTAVIVEGYTDVIMAHQLGCKNVVATLGTSLTAGHARLLRRYAKNIVLIFDSDLAGQTAAERALEICLTEKIDIKVASVPQGKDPCDFLVASGPEEFKKLIASALDVMTYQWEKLAHKFKSSDNLTDRREATEKFLLTIASAFKAGSIDPIDKGLIVNRLAGILQIPAEDIRKELSKRIKRGSAVAVATVPNAKVSATPPAKNISQLAQSEIIEVLLNEPRLFDSARRKINADSFDCPGFRQLWLLLESDYDQDIEFSLAGLLAKIDSPEIANTAVMLSDNQQDTETLKKRLAGAINALIEYNSKNKRGIPGQSEDEMLRNITKKASKPDRRNPGMISI